MKLPGTCVMAGPGLGGRGLQERDKAWQGPQRTRLPQGMGRDLGKVAQGGRQSLQLRAEDGSQVRREGRALVKARQKSHTQGRASPAQECALPHSRPEGPPSPKRLLGAVQIQVISHTLTLGISWYYFHLVRMSVVSAAHPKTQGCVHIKITSASEPNRSEGTRRMGFLPVSR